MDMAKLGEVFNLPTDGELSQQDLNRTSETICVTIDVQSRSVSVELYDILILYSDALFEEYGENYLQWQQEQQSQYLDSIHTTWQQENLFSGKAGKVASNLCIMEQEENPFVRECKRWWIKKRNEMEALKKFSTLGRTMRTGIEGYEKNKETDKKMETLFAVAADHFRGLPENEDIFVARRKTECANMANQLSNKHRALIGSSGSIARSLRTSFDYFYPTMPDRLRP